MSRAQSIVPVNGTAPARGKYVVAVPGHLAPLQRFDLPRGVSGPARVAVARQQLADRMGATATKMALIPMGDATWEYAVVCDRTDLQAWCETATASNPRCAAVLPDMLTLPSAKDTLVLQVDRNVLRVRSGLSEGFAAPMDMAIPLLQRLIAETNPSLIHAMGDMPPQLNEFLGKHDLTPTSGPLPPSRPAIDLRIALQKTQKPGLWAGLVAAGLGLLAFGLWVASLWVETRTLQQDAADVRAATMEVLREGLIPSGPILDIRQQVTQALASGMDAGQADSSSPVEILSRASVALFGTGLDIGAITLDRATGALDIEVTAETFAELDQVVARLNDTDLSDSGLSASATEPRSTAGGGVQARLRLTFAQENR